jgi:CubicO group peptidase (beta-lactamase class C family)
MLTTLRLHVPLGLLLLIPIRPLARAEDVDSARLAKIPARMAQFVEQGEVAGVVTVVGRKQGILSLEAVGSRNLEKHEPMTKDTLFRIASMTKPITAVGVMILADEGKLKIDDPVEKHLPEFRGQMLVAKRTPDEVTLKKPTRPITIRDLLTHTAGLPGGMPPGLSDLYVKRSHTLAEAVMAFSQRPLDFEPGSRWAYCNAGIDTLGRIIEVVSGQRYEDFLQKRIFDPLGMSDTAFYPTKEQRARVAVNYDRKNGKLVPASNPIIALAENARYPIPAGGLYSKAADLAKFYQMMLGGGTFSNTRVLSEASVAEMTKVQTGDLKAAFTPGMGFGLGWGVVRTPEGVTAMLSSGSYGHGGAFGTQAWIDPHKDLFVVLLIQRAGLPNSDASDMRRELQALAVDALKK